MRKHMVMYSFKKLKEELRGETQDDEMGTGKKAVDIVIDMTMLS